MEIGAVYWRSVACRVPTNCDFMMNHFTLSVPRHYYYHSWATHSLSPRSAKCVRTWWSTWSFSGCCSCYSAFDSVGEGVSFRLRPASSCLLINVFNSELFHRFVEQRQTTTLVHWDLSCWLAELLLPLYPAGSSNLRTFAHFRRSRTWSTNTSAVYHTMPGRPSSIPFRVRTLSTLVPQLAAPASGMAKNVWKFFN